RSGPGRPGRLDASPEHAGHERPGGRAADHGSGARDGQTRARWSAEHGLGGGLTVMPAAAAYSASKHFMDCFSEALRADLAGTGVAVTQVCPGPVDSEFDQIAGSAGGMTGGPPQFLRLSAA